MRCNKLINQASSSTAAPARPQASVKADPAAAAAPPVLGGGGAPVGAAPVACQIVFRDKGSRESSYYVPVRHSTHFGV